MKILSLFSTLLFCSLSFGQTESFFVSQYNNCDSLPGCTESFSISTATGSLDESGGTISINWGDGNSESINYTSPATNPTSEYYSHAYLVEGNYTVVISVYSSTLGANVGADYTFNWHADGPLGCGYLVVQTTEANSNNPIIGVPYDIVGSNGISTTINSMNLYQYYYYTGFDVSNAPYTVSINDLWLQQHGYNQTSPDIIITSFNPNGSAETGSINNNMQVTCINNGGDPDVSYNYGFTGQFSSVAGTGSITFGICKDDCTTAADVTVTIECPIGFTPNINNNNNQTAIFSGTTLTYTIPAFSGCIQEYLWFDFPVNTPAGTPFTFIINNSIPNDPTLSNNSGTINGFVLNSYDPNNKLVDKPTVINPNMDETLQYVINFQNEGNFAAMDVVVRDTIDADLDLSTLTVLGSKHSVTTSIDPSTRSVTFTFNDINLSPATQDEEASKGFVVYTVKENVGLPMYSEIENTAYIYFDFNPAIVTNTAYNINTVLSVNELTTETISMYPNPATDAIRFNGATVISASVFDMAGKQLIVADLIENNEVSVAQLANGIYQIVVTTATGIQTQKLVIRK